jgi:hypothetical protein
MGHYFDNVRLKGSLDAATREYETFKMRLASQERAERAPERVTQARAALAGATDLRGLDRAFSDAVRALRR